MDTIVIRMMISILITENLMNIKIKIVWVNNINKKMLDNKIRKKIIQTYKRKIAQKFNKR